MTDETCTLTSKIQLIARLRSIHDLEHDETEAVCEEAAEEIELLTYERNHAYNVLGWCLSCDSPRADCEKQWPEQRKCCPDCTHTAPAPESRDG